MAQTAYTAPFPGPLPEYINFSSEENGSNIVTVRSQGESYVSKINLPPADLLRMGEAMVTRAKKQLSE